MTFAHRIDAEDCLKLSPYAICRVVGHEVFLTFDDGPHPDHTPEVLDRLTAFGVRAAFFVIGEKAVAAPDLIERIRAEGHILGNHTWSHPKLRVCSSAIAEEQVGRCQAVVPSAKLFRAPYGILKPELWNNARSRGLDVVQWSLDSKDWMCRSESDAETCAAEVLSLVQPGDVILFHDRHRWIGPILDIVLPEIAQRTLVRRCD